MVQNQTYLFLVFSLTGVAIGILFDFFRILRKSFKTSDIITYLEDIVFWVSTGILILYNIWYFNNGEIRLFMFLGIIMGTMIYMLTLSNIIIKVFYTIIKFLKKIIIIPFKPIFFTIRKIYVIIRNVIAKNVKKLTNFSNKKGELERNGE